MDPRLVHPSKCFETPYYSRSALVRWFHAAHLCVLCLQLSWRASAKKPKILLRRAVLPRRGFSSTSVACPTTIRCSCILPFMMGLPLLSTGKITYRVQRWSYLPGMMYPLVGLQVDTVPTTALRVILSVSALLLYLSLGTTAVGTVGKADI